MQLLGERVTQAFLRDVKLTLTKGCSDLLRSDLADNERLWPSPLRVDDQFEQKYSNGRYTVYRSIYDGVAGVVYVLSNLAKEGYSQKTLRSRVRHSVNWLIDARGALDGDLPGLYFGNAGVAVAICEAVSANLVEETKSLHAALKRNLVGKLDWCDITHGAAGQGMAAIYCGAVLGDENLKSMSRRCARYLISKQADNGSFQVPPGAEGMSGKVYHGFAHGTAGIVYFLAEYLSMYADAEVRQSLDSSVEFLTSKALSSRNSKSIDWTIDSSGSTVWRWWCHGSPGIALTFLKLYELFGDSKYERMARRALNSRPLGFRSSNLSLCHGLAGLGEIYLDAYRILGDEEWNERAADVAYTLMQLQHVKHGKSTWFVEKPNVPCAGLMIGSAGIIHFLLRFVARGSMSFPALL